MIQEFNAMHTGPIKLFFQSSLVDFDAQYGKLRSFWGPTVFCYKTYVAGCNEIQK